MVPGDLLALQMPAVARAVNFRAEVVSQPHLCRVSKTGSIILPIIDEVQVAGKTLAEIEAALVKIYHPKYLLDRPTIVAQIAEYRTVYVSIVGGVFRAGIYQLRSDELTLVALLMKAGGILPEGYSIIRLHRPGKDGKQTTLALPIKDANAPFVDVPLKGGETVEVTKLSPQVFTVVGLVNRPGTYPFPREPRFNLPQALASAGGVDPVGDPRYASIYRQDAKGKVVSARFRLNARRSDWWFFADSSLGDGAFVDLKPGDIVFVEKNVRTRTRTVLYQVVYVRIGATAGAHTEATYYKDYSASGSE